MPRKLSSYKGRLNPEQVAEGINTAGRNAHRLADDAQTLLNLGRFPSAASLAILSIEESGKIPILRRMALAETDEEALNLWRDYRSHTKKNIMWLLPQLVAEGARKLKDFRPLFDSQAEHPHILDQVKQISIYTDCLGEIHWSEPTGVIDADLAATLSSIARLLTPKNPVTVEEIRLWVKHMRSVRYDAFTEQTQALLGWYTEMQQLELAEPGLNLKEVSDWLGLRAA